MCGERSERSRRSTWNLARMKGMLIVFITVMVSKLLKLYTLIVDNLLSVNYTSVNLKKKMMFNSEIESI